MLFQQSFGIAWVIGEQDFDYLRTLHQRRLTAEVPQGIVMDYWKGFETMGDGLHPTPDTTKRAAQRIATAILP